MSASLASSLASLPEPERLAILDGLSDEELAQLEYDWRFWARPEQIEPEGDWSTWVALAGRGFGKTESGAQWIQERVIGGSKLIALVAETQKDLEEVMVARLVKIAPPGNVPSVRYKPVRVTWPSGAVAYGYNGTEPNQLRGPEFDTAWVDEFAKYRYAREVWDMLQFTMRSGEDPRVFITTTPRPIPVLREILADATTVVTTGSTFDNAGNLAPTFLRKIRSRYEGTRLGRQELNAEMLDDLPGALWTRENLDEHRRPAIDADGKPNPLPPMRRIVVAVDPSGTAGDDEAADSVGIIVAGKGIDGRGYVIADCTTDEGPAGWSRIAVDAYKKYGADRIVAERNFGGAMVEHTIRTADPLVSFKNVTASRGKVVRAEPIAALYEQGRVSHIGAFPELEDQMCDFGPEGYIGDGSPDRADSLVWAMHELAFGGETIFDVPFDRIAVDPFAIPAHWPKAYAIERKDGEIAALWGAIDPTDGVIHFYAEHTVPQATMTLQAAAIRARGEWIPGMFPKQAPGRSKTEGQALMRELKDGGLLLRNVPYAEEVTETVDQVNLGRVRVFNNLRGFEREYRGYQRDEKGDLSETGLLMTCFRTWIGAGRSVAKVKDDDIAQSAAVTAGGIY